MDQRQFLEKIGDEYRQSGYVVTTHPDKDHLPQRLGDLGIDLLARRGEEAIAIRVKSRDQLYDLHDVQQLAERVKGEPGWRLDLVVFPPEGGVEVPRDGAEPDIDHIRSLAEEASRALGVGVVRASFLLAWATVEAAMREAARREEIAMDREVPRFVLKTLYSNGIISREDYDRVEHCFHVRNALVHGFAPPPFEATQVEFLLDFARRLLSPEPVQTDA
jgi:hypothetical protein